MLKAEVLAKLREIMRGDAEDAKLVDADSLLHELENTVLENSVDANTVFENRVADDAAAADTVGGEPMGGASAAAAAPATPTPQNAVWSPTQTMHINHTSNHHKIRFQRAPPSLKFWTWRMSCLAKHPGGKWVEKGVGGIFFKRCVREQL
jgi:hypothetical protein